MAVEVAEPRPEELDLETTKRITDLEVMALISAGHRNAYHRALGVLTLYPDYAMASFRKLLEQIVILVGEKLQLAFSSPDLYERINYLDESQAYLGLYFLYITKESPCFSPVKAIGILEQGVSRDDPNCKFQLGVVFHQGELVGEDKTRARQLLTEASDQGVKRAALYLRLAVDEGFQQQLQMIGLALMAAPNAEREKYKALALGRNDLCPCNSGKKYKKCHGQ